MVGRRGLAGGIGADFLEEVMLELGLEGWIKVSHGCVERALGYKEQSLQ